MPATTTLPDTRLPRQVRERMERIEAMNGPVNGAPSPIAAEVAPPPGDAAAANPPPAPPPEEAPNPNEPPRPDLRPFHDPALDSDPRANDPMYWRKRLSVDAGMWKQRLQRERAESDAREAELREKVTSLEAQVKQLQQAGKPAAIDLSSLFTPEQLEALGEDQANAIAAATLKAAQQQVTSALSEQRTAEETRRTQDTKSRLERRKREFFDDLEELVPDWAAVNAREDWLQWLTGTDSRTGQTRQAALAAGEQGLDAQAVAAVFEAFKASLLPKREPPVAAPRAAGPTAAVPDASDPMGPPTDAEIKDYYKRLSVNRGKGVSEEERKSMERRMALM